MRPALGSVEYCRPSSWQTCSTFGFIFWMWLGEWLPFPTMLWGGGGWGISVVLYGILFFAAFLSHAHGLEEVEGGECWG